MGVKYLDEVFKGFWVLYKYIFLYLAIPLFGWGLDDLRGFFSSPPRSGYGVVICFVGLIVGFQAVIEPKGIRGSSGKKAN